MTDIQSPALSDDPIARLADTARTDTTPCGPDGKITWRSWGQGPPLLLVHGGFGSWMHWIRNIGPLSRRHRVIAVDLPGLGDSTEAPQPHTAGAIAELLHDGLPRVVADEEGPIVIAGFSLGGAIASALAARLQQRVQKLVLTSPTGIGPLWKIIDGLPRRRSGMSAEELDALARVTLARTMIANPARIDPLAIEVQSRLLSRRRYLNGTAIAATDVTLSMLEACHRDCRVMIIWGENDVYLRDGARGSEPIVTARLPDVDIRILAGAGHWVQYEAADAVNALIGAACPTAAPAPAGPASRVCTTGLVS